MLVFYKLSGINAIVAMAINLLVLLALMAYFGATMTLPGIAGFILTIGMGVDSNVLIFERIKEELAAQNGVKAAVAAGFDRVFLTILDTHVSSLIAAAFLFQFGTGPIRGFAVTLSIGLLTNVFTSVFVSRTLFELALARRRAAFAEHLDGHRGIGPCRSSRTPTTTSSDGGGTRCCCHLWSSSAASTFTLARNGIPLGIDFTGGTIVVLRFQQPVSDAAVRTALDVLPGEKVVQQYRRRCAGTKS